MSLQLIFTRPEAFASIPLIIKSSAIVSVVPSASLANPIFSPIPNGRSVVALIELSLVTKNSVTATPAVILLGAFNEPLTEWNTGFDLKRVRRLAVSS